MRDLKGLVSGSYSVAMGNSGVGGDLITVCGRMPKGDYASENVRDLKNGLPIFVKEKIAVLVGVSLD